MVCSQSPGLRYSTKNREASEASVSTQPQAAPPAAGASFLSTCPHHVDTQPHTHTPADAHRPSCKPVSIMLFLPSPGKMYADHAHVYTHTSFPSCTCMCHQDTRHCNSCMSYLALMRVPFPKSSFTTRDVCTCRRQACTSHMDTVPLLAPCSVHYAFLKQ